MGMRLLTIVTNTDIAAATQIWIFTHIQMLPKKL
jgi:hypothetical protein